MEISSNFKQSIFIFLLQIALVSFIGKEILNDPEMIEFNYDLMVIRFVCAFLLHIQLEREAKVAIDMLKFQCFHRPLFDSNYQPFCISMMKLTAAWSTEVMNIILICRQDNVMEAVMNFIALGVIAEIDNFYAARLF